MTHATRRGFQRVTFALALLVVMTPLRFVRAEAAPSKPTIDAKAEKILRDMCTEIASAKQLSVRGTRIIDRALLRELSWIPYHGTASFEADIVRPDKIKTVVRGTYGRREFYSNGETAGAYDQDQNVYAVAEAKETIMDVLKHYKERYRLTPPFAEFLVADPYTSLTQNAVRVSYNGQMEVEGESCDEIVFEGILVDRRLYVSRATGLPHRMELLVKFQDGRKPRFVFNFAKWDLSPEFGENHFTLDPPASAQRVERIDAP